MNIVQAFWGGIHNFFSIWIFCLMQIIPFFMAFMVGGALLACASEKEPPQWKNALPALVVPLAGYFVTFVLMGMTTTGISKAIFNRLELFNQLGGVVMGLVGFYYAGWLSFGESTEAIIRKAKWAFGLAFGAALALAYKPCVTPTLTVIINMNTLEDTAGTGAVMLAFYTLGTITTIFAAGLLLVLLSFRISSEKARGYVKMFCGVVLLAASLLILTGKMTDYKSFLVGRFVEDAGHSGMHGGMHH